MLSILGFLGTDKLALWPPTYQYTTLLCSGSHPTLYTSGWNLPPKQLHCYDAIKTAHVSEGALVRAVVQG